MALDFTWFRLFYICFSSNGDYWSPTNPSPNRAIVLPQEKERVGSHVHDSSDQHFVVVLCGGVDIIKYSKEVESSLDDN